MFLHIKHKSKTMPDTLTVKIWRGDKNGSFKTFTVPARENQTVLDVVTYVQRNLESTLTYRFACRVGMCGSCAMTVNGAPAWTCRTHVNKVTKNGQLTIEPLRNLEIIRDLTTDMAPFFEKWQTAGGKFKGCKTRDDKIPQINPESKTRLTASAAIECINCAVCFAACDTVAARPDYVGPAALNRVWSLFNDEKHTRQKALRISVTANGGCFTCHTQASCSNHCPVKLDPAGAIAGLKNAYGLFGSRP
jgi:fumarate reductase iron-sulfur subunit